MFKYKIKFEIEDLPVKPSRPSQDKPKQSLTSAVEQVKNEIEFVSESSQKNDKSGSEIVEQVNYYNQYKFPIIYCLRASEKIFIIKTDILDDFATAFGERTPKYQDQKEEIILAEEQVETLIQPIIREYSLEKVKNHTQFIIIDSKIKVVF